MKEKKREERRQEKLRQRRRGNFLKERRKAAEKKKRKAQRQQEKLQQKLELRKQLRALKKAREKEPAFVFLSTHIMEEAEAICSEMAIQVAGSWRCLGSAAHLRNRFCGGYEVNLKLDSFAVGNVKTVRKFLLQLGRIGGVEEERVFEPGAGVGCVLELVERQFCEGGVRPRSEGK